jgi:hypothetical protein
MRDQNQKTQPHKTMPENQNESPEPKDAEGVESSGLLGWVNASRHPLADVAGGSYMVLAGYETRRLFALRLRVGWEFHAGSLNEDGDIIDDCGNAVGRQVDDVDYYVEIYEPNAEVCHPPETELRSK